MDEVVEERTGPGWARAITYASLLVALAALVWTLYSVGLAALWKRLSLLGPWLGAVIGIEVLVSACDAAAIYWFVGAGQRKLRYLHAVLAQVAGRAVNVVTPTGSLGEVVKIAMLVEHVAQPRAIAAVLLYNVASFEMSLALIAVGAPLTAFLLHVPEPLRTTLVAAGGIAAVAAFVLPWLVHHGMLSSIVGLARKLRIVNERRFARWHRKLASVDDRLRDGSQARRHERFVGFAFLVASRALSWLITFVLVYAAGGPTSVGFLAAVVTAGQLITWISGIVPLGLGLSEGGNYALFAALGAEPAIGVTMALGRRVTHIIYAGIGLVLVSVSQTVKDVRTAHARRR